MAGYFSVEYFRMIGSVPGPTLAQFEEENPGRLEALIVAVSRLMDSYLFKRHATPFQAPVPEVVKFHGAQILSHQLRVIIGFDPGSQQDQQIVDARNAAFAWLEKGANAKDGLVELPKREPEPGQQDVAAVSRRKARAFSYRSPIDWHRARRGY